MEEFTKIGSISPFIVSPGPGVSPKKNNGTTVFFPTGVANGDAKLTTVINGITFSTQTPDNGNMHPSIVKMETPMEASACCVGDDKQ